jgi:hypothetical protein
MVHPQISGADPGRLLVQPPGDLLVVKRNPQRRDQLRQDHTLLAGLYQRGVRPDTLR